MGIKSIINIVYIYIWNAKKSLASGVFERCVRSFLSLLFVRATVIRRALLFETGAADDLLGAIVTLVFLDRAGGGHASKVVILKGGRVDG